MTPENEAAVQRLIERHKQADIFIVGAGGSLKEHLPYLKFALRDCIVIGVNRTSYAVNSTYFISAYLSEIYLALARDNSTLAIHCRPKLYQPSHPSIVSMQRKYSDRFDQVQRTVDPREPTLITRNNVFFLASHLAVVLGAKRIIYVGFDMDNKAHFYEEDTDLKKAMFDDLISLQPSWSEFGADHRYETPFEIMKKLFSDPGTLKAAPFYTWDHAPFISQFADHAKDLGVELQSCTKTGVLARAGLAHFDLRELLVERAEHSVEDAGSNLTGCIDAIRVRGNSITIVGWAMDLQFPGTSPWVFAAHDRKVLSTTDVDLVRADVALAHSLPGNTKCGFEIRLEGIVDTAEQATLYVISKDGRCARLIRKTTNR